MSLLTRTVTSVGWTTLTKVAQQVVQLGLSIALMRLLGPEAFGLLAMVLVFSGFASIFSELGFDMALVQRRELEEAHKSTIFWFNAAAGLCLALGMLFAAPWVAKFYKEPELEALTSWLALSFVLGAPRGVPRSLLRKELRFDVLAKADIGALVASSGAAVAVAVLGGGVWSLVTQQLVNVGVNSLLIFRGCDWRPRLIWSQSALKDLLGYSLGLVGFNVINYWARSADKLLIGSFMGSIALGLYSRAYALMLLPLSHIISVLAPVMFPALSSIQNDRERVRRIFLQVICVLTSVAFPMMMGLIVVAEPFVLGLVGPDWVRLIPLIQMLSVVGMTQTLCNPVGWIYASQGRTDWMFWWGVGGAGFLIVSIVVGIQFGTVEAVAIAYLLGNLVITAPCLAIPGRLIGMRLRDIWRVIRGNLACAAVMALFVWVVGRVLPEQVPAFGKLAIQVGVGMVVYAGLVIGTRQLAWEELAELREKLRARRAGRIEKNLKFEI